MILHRLSYIKMEGSSDLVFYCQWLIFLQNYSKRRWYFCNYVYQALGFYSIESSWYDTVTMVLK